jgi:hypothetical protein
MRTERRIADWQCNRCGNIEQTTVAVLRDNVGQVSGYEEGLEQTASLPNGWSHVTINWNRGTLLAQDLCTTCTEKIDGFMQRRYDVAEPAKDVVQDEPGEPAPKPKRAPRKRTAKKAT